MFPRRSIQEFLEVLEKKRGEKKRKGNQKKNRARREDIQDRNTISRYI